MSIPYELLSLKDKQQGTMEKKMIEAFVQKKSVEAIVEIAKTSLKEGNSTEN